MLQFHFGMFMDKHINQITPSLIDQWIDELTDPRGWRLQDPNRKGFDHELVLLRTILRYYENYSDQYHDPDFKIPIRQRHADRVKGSKSNGPIKKRKDLPEEDFHLWREEASKGPYPEIIPLLGTIQYYESLRISEAAAIHWEDVFFDWVNPENSYITICRHIDWARKKGVQSVLLPGFKNSKHLPDGIKTYAMYPEVFEALKKLYTPGAKGLVFHWDGQFLEYRWIQHAYDAAFRRAGLPYSGTHVMRHGGSSMVLNKTGDATLAQQQLGVTSLKTTMVYAKRSSHALRDFAKNEWLEWKKRNNT
jgi:integrase